MKRVFVGIAGLALASAQMKLPGVIPKGTCPGGALIFLKQTFKGNPNHHKVRNAYDRRVEAGLAKFNEKSSMSFEDQCADSSARVAEMDTFEEPMDYIESLGLDSSNCGGPAFEASSVRFHDMLCRMQSSADGPADAMRSTDDDTEDNAWIFSQVSSEIEDGGDQLMAGFTSMEEGAAKKVRTPKEIALAFRKATGKVWNIIYSGGPEYCKDMMPKFPRVNWGHMRPGHPNYEAIVDIRDNCVALLKIVRAVKCYCQYILWGDVVTWPRPSRASWKNKFNKNEQRTCWYLSNLKGTGCYRPPKRPYTMECAKPHRKRAPVKKRAPKKKKKKPSNRNNNNRG